MTRESKKKTKQRKKNVNSFFLSFDVQLWVVFLFYRSSSTPWGSDKKFKCRPQYNNKTELLLMTNRYLCTIVVSRFYSNNLLFCCLFVCCTGKEIFLFRTKIPLISPSPAGIYKKKRAWQRVTLLCRCSRMTRRWKEKKKRSKIKKTEILIFVVVSVASYFLV